MIGPRSQKRNRATPAHKERDQQQVQPGTQTLQPSTGQISQRAIRLFLLRPIRGGVVFDDCHER
jgi:hypothetical protein